MKPAMLAAALAVLGSAQIAGASNHNSNSNQCTTPLQAVQQEESYNRLEQLVNAAEAGSELDAPDAEWTVFAPVNSAFDSYLNQLELSPEAVLFDKRLARAILYNHVAAGAYRTEDLGDGQKLDLVFPDNKSVTATSSEVTTIDGEPVQANYVNTDVEACNSYIHAVDRIIHYRAFPIIIDWFGNQPPFPDDLNLYAYGPCIGDYTDYNDPCAYECYLCEQYAYAGADKSFLRKYCGFCRDCSAYNNKYWRHGKCQYKYRG
jgi:uncharacterized surface protein with fasciclin (FAS1) repeats